MEGSTSLHPATTFPFLSTAMSLAFFILTDVDPAFGLNILPALALFFIICNGAQLLLRNCDDSNFLFDRGSSQCPKARLLMLLLMISTFIFPFQINLIILSSELLSSELESCVKHFKIVRFDRKEYVADNPKKYSGERNSEFR